jgi:hypothetical protein
MPSSARPSRWWTLRWPPPSNPNAVRDPMPKAKNDAPEANGKLKRDD